MSLENSEKQIQENQPTSNTETQESLNEKKYQHLNGSITHAPITNERKEAYETRIKDAQKSNKLRTKEKKNNVFEEINGIIYEEDDDEDSGEGQGEETD